MERDLPQQQFEKTSESSARGHLGRVRNGHCCRRELKCGAICRGPPGGIWEKRAGPTTGRLSLSPDGGNR